MRMVIQRVSSASVDVEGKTVGKIGKGYAVFLGVGEGDKREYADKMIEKMIKLRIFPDEQGKINLSLKDVGGELLLISQFTLYADYKKGNRPSFIHSAEPEEAKKLYEYAIERCRAMEVKVEHGIFGADMKVSLVNDGPFTMVLDSDILIK